MPAKKKPGAKKPTDKFIGIKVSCNNVGETVYSTLPAAIKAIKQGDDYPISLAANELDAYDDGDSVIIYKLTPVYKITVGGFTETAL
jgi:hypothetical protein